MGIKFLIVTGQSYTIMANELKLSDYFNIILKYKYLILLILLISLSGGFVFYKYEVPTYTATSYLVVGKETIGKTYDIGSVQKTSTMTTLAKSYPFLSERVNAMADIYGDDLAELRSIVPLQEGNVTVGPGDYN